jgi:hypothetical protein
MGETPIKKKRIFYSITFGEVFAASTVDRESSGSFETSESLEVVVINKDFSVNENRLYEHHQNIIRDDIELMLFFIESTLYLTR